MTLHAPLEEVATDDDLSHIRNSLIALLSDSDTMALLHRAAERYARVPRGALVARELVADVIGDMYAGTLKRNTRHAAVASQLVAEIHRRAKRARRRSKHDVTIDGLSDRKRPSTENAGAESSNPRAVVDLRQLLARAREDVGEDPYARQLIALYELGFVDKRTILRLGMPEGVYQTTRARVMSALRARAQHAEAEHEAEQPLYRSVDPERAISALFALRRFGAERAESDRAGDGADLPARRIAATRKP